MWPKGAKMKHLAHFVMESAALVVLLNCFIQRTSTSSSLCTGFLKYFAAEEPLTFAIPGFSVWYFSNPLRLKQLIAPCSLTINCFHFQGKMARKVSLGNLSL